MRSTIRAGNLDPAHIIIQTAIYRPWDFIIERRPTAMRVEFVI
jgi:hypothetical protein